MSFVLALHFVNKQRNFVNTVPLCYAFIWQKKSCTGKNLSSPETFHEVVFKL